MPDVVLVEHERKNGRYTRRGPLCLLLLECGATSNVCITVFKNEQRFCKAFIEYRINSNNANPVGQKQVEKRASVVPSLFCWCKINLKCVTENGGSF